MQPALILSSAQAPSRSKPSPTCSSNDSLILVRRQVRQRNAVAFQVALGDRIGHLPDPRLQRALVAVLVQALVHAQEGFLAQLTGVLRVPHHALDDVPAQTLVLAHQALEGTWRVGQHGIDQRAVFVQRIVGDIGNCMHATGYA